jgi:A/G-specific adenine glycosylase
MLNLLAMKFTTLLLNWYKKNKRDLPWRQTRDPYKIWLSEIILQQTRIAQGLDYYLKFINRYPDVCSLAQASENDILKLWQGLGYYSRARNLHLTAIKIDKEHQGRFPDNYNDLLKLKGIGEYTAAAISSIAFNESRPVVDGNVLRFLSRIAGITAPVDTNAGKKQVTDIAVKLIDKKQPGEFNQALMEFGALYCKPKNPNCNDCIFKNKCKANLENQESFLPVKTKKPEVRKRYFHYLFMVYKNKWVYLRKRSEQDIWKNLFDFPLIEKPGTVAQKKMIAEIWDYIGLKREIKLKMTVSKEYRHVLSHQLIISRFYIILFDELKNFRKVNSQNNNCWVEVALNKIHDFPIPRLIEIFLKKNNFI